MIFNKKTVILVLILFSINSFSFSKINLQIAMKINNQIVTSFDLEKESNYLLALNPKLKEINESNLSKLAKRSITKEIIKKSEILKYKELNLQNDQINNVLNNIIQNLNFANISQFENYLKNFGISVNDIKKKN